MWTLPYRLLRVHLAGKCRAHGGAGVSYGDPYDRRGRSPCPQGGAGIFSTSLDGGGVFGGQLVWGQRGVRDPGGGAAAPGPGADGWVPPPPRPGGSVAP